MSHVFSYQQIKLLFFDVDGVFTDGKIWQNSHGQLRRSFSIRDTMALRRIRKTGLKIVVFNRESSPEIRSHFDSIGVDLIIEGSSPCYEHNEMSDLVSILAGRFGLQVQNIAVMSQNIRDVSALAMAGLGVTVISAAPELKQVAGLVTQRLGGDGAVLEFCGLILDCLQDMRKDTAPSRRSGWRQGQLMAQSQPQARSHRFQSNEPYDEQRNRPRSQPHRGLNTEPHDQETNHDQAIDHLMREGEAS